MVALVALLVGAVRAVLLSVAHPVLGDALRRVLAAEGAAGARRVARGVRLVCRKKQEEIALWTGV